MADVRQGGSQVIGEAAHDAPVQGNPVLIGAYASSTALSPVSTGDVCYLRVDPNGRLQVGLIEGMAGVAGGSGSTTDFTLRTVLATDDPSVVSLQLLDDVVLVEDAAHSSGDKGIMALAVRRDTASALAGTNGDYIPLTTDSSGRLWVTESNSGTIASLAKTGGAVADPSSAGVFIFAVRNDGAAGYVGVDDSDYSPISVDSAGRVGVSDLGGSITVDNAGTFAVQASIAAGATTIGKAEDAASADADVGVPAMAVRKATPANTSGTDGDYEMLQMSAGRLWTSATIDAALPAGANAIGKLAANSGVDIGDVDVTSVVPGTGATNLGKAEDAAHASGDTGVMMLAVRQDTPAAMAGTDGDYIPLTTDSTGRVYVNVGNTVTVASHAVTNAGTFAVQIDGAALTSLQLIDDVVYAEDVASANGDKGVMVLAKRTDTPAASSGTDGDYEPLQTSGGRLWTTQSAGTIAAGQVSVTTTSGTVVASRAGRLSVTIVNHGTTDVYLGAGTVTTSNGILLVGTKGAAITLNTAAAINGIVGTGTQTVSYIEEY